MRRNQNFETAFGRESDLHLKTFRFLEFFFDFSFFSFAFLFTAAIDLLMGLLAVRKLHCHPCPPRSNNEHRLQALEVLNQTTAGDCTNLDQRYGTRYTELMLLPYFHFVRFNIIDPMHNLFNGTAKHILKNVWLDPEKPLLDKNNLQQIQEKMDKLKVPASVGRIQNSFGGFTANQWKSFKVLFSMYAL